MRNYPFTSHAGLTETLAYFNISLLHEPEQLGHLVVDSREIANKDIYLAVIGHVLDGRHYIDNAIAAGAQFVLSECATEQEHGNVSYRNNVAIVQFYQLSLQLFNVCQQYYQQPQAALNVIGITGTNGKTSVSLLTAKLLDAANQACGVIGTLGAGRVNSLTETGNTTPGATQLHQWFCHFLQQGLSHVAMEVSSHALAQRRVDASFFDVAVFTNLSRDHLDYHETMAEYAQAKYQLFTGTEQQFAIVNGDDEQAKAWLANWPIQQGVMVYGRTFSTEQYRQYLLAENITRHSHGVNFTLNCHVGCIEISSPLIGDFNIDNLLAAIGVLIHQGLSLSAIKQAVEKLSPIIGRMETFTAPNKTTAVVDYAHTPDALENALNACRQHCQGDVWLVFGCGGDRDRGKRKLMAKAAEQGADHIIITNDNPRTESPMAIAEDVLAGCRYPNKTTVQLDRQKAVISALTRAKAKDMVLLAGKGHEDYIIIGEDKIAYNERQLVKSTFENGVLS